MDQLPPVLTRFVPDILEAHAAMILRALLALPIATAIGALLAFRPRRRGTPPRSAPVIQTQIILAVVGAVVMLIVGASLARAFGIVGAANLIRYRAKIDDPKDAVVMLVTLSLGLACGVELYGLAAFAAVFILGVLWVVESLEPERTKIFELKVTTADPTAMRSQIESILRRYHIDYELRTAATKELVYETELPLHTRTDRVANAILTLDDKHETEVTWDEKKKK
ncbi:MAG TPA: MgtC/SapB family protein [Vicinamibacterales bacterium]|nr:MgtC/SapB family protein [Vicinamibacterales bacterium]